MPWSYQDYPDSMKNLPKHIRKKAIDIANALLEEDSDEGRAIPIAIAQARKYYHQDGERAQYELIQDENDWILKKQSGKRAIIRKQTKNELMDDAKQYVKKHNGILNIYTSDGDISDTLYE